jgi:hypothetical protein
MYSLLVGVSEEGELHLVMDENVSKPIHVFYLLFLLFFSFKRIFRGNCPGLVTNGGNVTHKHFT